MDMLSSDAASLKVLAELEDNQNYLLQTTMLNSPQTTACASTSSNVGITLSALCVRLHRHETPLPWPTSYVRSGIAHMLESALTLIQDCCELQHLYVIHT